MSNPALAPDLVSRPNGNTEGRINTRMAQRITGKLLNLSAEQAIHLSYPVGCPVWYNISESTGPCLDIREGVVTSAHLDISTRTVFFKIERKTVSEPSLIDTVCDDDVSYAPNCPVVHSSIDSTSSEKVDGVVIFAKPVRDEKGSRSLSYTVSFFLGPNHFFRVEEGVTSSRLK